MFNTAFHIREIQCYSCTVILVDGGFYVTKKRTGFLFHPFSRFQKSFGKSCLGIRVISMNVSFKTDGNAPRFFHGGFLCIVLFFLAVVTVAVLAVFMVVVVSGHCIIS